MSSTDKNLSTFDVTSMPDGNGLKIGVVVSEWNHDITKALGDACTKTLQDHGVQLSDITQIHVPGAYELPLGARMLLATGKYDGVVCLGCVIKGETKHDEYINQSVANGLMQLNLSSGKPVIFGLLTPNDGQQAIDRAGGKHGNKGTEAAVTVIKMIALGKSMKEQKKGIGFS